MTNNTSWALQGRAAVDAKIIVAYQVGSDLYWLVNGDVRRSVSSQVNQPVWFLRSVRIRTT